MPFPGFAAYFVGGQQGRPLLFVAEEAGRSLVQAMPRIVAEIRRAVGDRRFTIVFDRGGYDGQLFAWLAGEGAGLTTYPTAQPHLPLAPLPGPRPPFRAPPGRLRLAQ